MKLFNAISYSQLKKGQQLHHVQVLPTGTIHKSYEVLDIKDVCLELKDLRSGESSLHVMGEFSYPHLMFGDQPTADAYACYAGQHILLK